MRTNLKKIKVQLLRFWNDEQGQSTTEYILILSVVVMVALKFKTLFGQQLMSLLNSVSSQMDQATQNTN